MRIKKELSPGLKRLSEICERLELWDSGLEWCTEGDEVPTDGVFLIIPAFCKVDEKLLAAWNEGLDEDDQVRYLDNIDGLECGYSNEYDKCCSCQAVIRTAPDSYSWMPTFRLIDEGYECRDCIAENAEEYLDSAAERNAHAPDHPEFINDHVVNPKDYGWTLITEENRFDENRREPFEGWCGYYDGEAFDARKAVRALSDAGFDVLIGVRQEQFRARYRFWVRPTETDDDSENVIASLDDDQINEYALKIASSRAHDMPISPAMQLKQFLEGI